MQTEANLEKLATALNALQLAGDFMQSADPRGWIRKSNVLLDACLDAGMSPDTDDHVAWAVEAVTSWLCSSPLAEAA